ncbi:MAG: hypothetical protein IJI25_07780 [Eubacterium sp.]|nr:hypothetical protein [Eubacterium sp.]
MKKRNHLLLIIFFLTVPLLLSVQTNAKEPEIMASLRSDIQVYGPIANFRRYGSDKYMSKIAYQKKYKRFLFYCTYTNGRSQTSIKMYMPVSKKKASYTVYFNETVRASGKTGKISGKAILKRKTYNNRTTNIKFSRKNKTSAAKKIKNGAYQGAANSSLKVAFSLWEESMEKRTTLCFPNFGFNRIYVFNKSLYTYEW